MKEDRVEVRNAHNHEPDLRQSQRLNARMTVLEAATSSSAPLKQTFDDACRELPGSEMIGYGDYSRTMTRRRREHYPPPPTDPKAANDFMRSAKYKDKNYAHFYQGMVSSADGEKGLVFAHPENLAKLNEETKTLQTDGTFRTAPALSAGNFYQILIILAMYKGHLLPVCKVLMTGKTRLIYDSAFKRVKELLPDSVNPTLIMSDYEKALMGSARATWPAAKVVGCWFHFSQNIFKRMSKLGLIWQFKSNDTFYAWLKMVMALPLLPTDRIAAMWTELKSDSLGNVPLAKLRKLKNYIEKTWIIQRIDVLSVHGEEARTNNGAECYNGRWNRRVQVKHPNFWTLCEKIHEAFSDIEKDMCRLDLGLKISERRKNKNVLNNERLKTAERRLGETYTSRQFLKVATHTFNITNKRYFKELETALDDDPLRGDDEETDDDLGGELDFPPEDLFHQDEDDVEITLN